MNWTNITCSTSINIYIYIYKQRPHVEKHEVLPSGTLYDILLIQASTSSKFSIYVKLLSNSMNWTNIICSTSINIYIYIYKQSPCMGKHEVLPSGTLYDILLIQASKSSKFSIYVKLLSNSKCIYFNVLIKFKKFVYIYNFTCFELIQMDLKSRGKCRNKI